jgi:hypothetical protein
MSVFNPDVAASDLGAFARLNAPPGGDSSPEPVLELADAPAPLRPALFLARLIPAQGRSRIFYPAYFDLLNSYLVHVDNAGGVAGCLLNIRFSVHGILTSLGSEVVKESLKKH